MKYLFILVLIFPGFLKACEDSALLNEVSIVGVRTAAEEGDGNCQFIMGILLELGYGVPQNIEEAAGWFGYQQSKGTRELKRGLVYYALQEQLFRKIRFLEWPWFYLDHLFQKHIGMNSKF